MYHGPTNSRTQKRADSYNPGLERLSQRMLGLKFNKKENRLRTQKKKQDLEMQTFLKLTSTTQNEFHNKWAWLILVANLYNLFTSSFFLGLRGFPGSI